jgi:hypothetical protein
LLQQRQPFLRVNLQYTAAFVPEISISSKKTLLLPLLLQIKKAHHLVRPTESNADFNAVLAVQRG